MPVKLEEKLIFCKMSDGEGRSCWWDLPYLSHSSRGSHIEYNREHDLHMTCTHIFVNQQFRMHYYWKSTHWNWRSAIVSCTDRHASWHILNDVKKKLYRNARKHNLRGKPLMCKSIVLSVLHTIGWVSESSHVVSIETLRLTLFKLSKQ